MYQHIKLTCINKMEMLTVRQTILSPMLMLTASCHKGCRVRQHNSKSQMITCQIRSSSEAKGLPLRVKQLLRQLPAKPMMPVPCHISVRGQVRQLCNRGFWISIAAGYGNKCWPELLGMHKRVAARKTANRLLDKLIGSYLDRATDLHPKIRKVCA